MAGSSNLMYPTGVSSTPIDLVSGAQAFSQAAVEQRLKEIQENRETVSENYKNILKASSITALPELSQQLRTKYQGEIEKYRNDIIGKFKNKGGKLDMNDQREIQDRYMDMQQNMLSDVNTLKQYDSFRQNMMSPNFDNVYDRKGYETELANVYSDINSGKDVGNLTARFAQYFVPPSLSDRMFSRYSKEIAGIDIATKGEWVDANTFRFNTAEDEAEVDRAVDYFFKNDPVAARQDTPEERAHFKDVLIKSQSEYKTYDPKRGSRSGSSYTPYVSKEQGSEIIGKGEGKIVAPYAATVSLTDVTPFVFGRDKYAPEAVKWMYVAKNKDVYKKKAGVYPEEYNESGELSNINENLIIDESLLDKFNPDEYERKAFVKVAAPKDKSIEYMSYEDLVGKTNNIETKFLPLDNQNLKSALYGKMGTKREGYLSAIDQVNNELGSVKKETKRNEVERLDKKTGKIYIFDADTKEFIREK